MQRVKSKEKTSSKASHESPNGDAHRQARPWLTTLAAGQSRPNTTKESKLLRQHRKKGAPVIAQLVLIVFTERKSQWEDKDCRRH
ncbi:hypothetical protein TNIN_18771 [Trichonephila inaurata madagascariensis]|uniref:Uncharacterized protein n=1 Tax=Trichonephila inaurata madagascariensis TaxID=2747483 RepID=A0A8X6MG13_9ARAC|nr:hypothetical protein TNIN_18771 [Trichonephila inaurata madagascariensis]